METIAGRAILVAVEDTPNSQKAFEWAVDQFYQSKDTINLVSVLKCMPPSLEVYHGVPGTSFNVHTATLEQSRSDVEAVGNLIRARYLPLLEERQLKYQIHIYAETLDAPAQALGYKISQVADEVNAIVVVLASHNKRPISDHEKFLGSVAEWCIAHIKRPVAVVR